jgi:Transglycosylase SLT domain
MRPALRYSVPLLIALSIIGSIFVQPPLARADNGVYLSAYWNKTITRWADSINLYAAQRGLDPDLVASIIFEESHGNPGTISSAGAVGLMQIMPFEQGFTWRPTSKVLLDPVKNIAWGTTTLSQVIRQAQGRLHLALLAYNSGWDQINLRITRAFAIKVLDHYARSILTNSGVDVKNVQGWKMIIVTHSSAGPVQADRVLSDGNFEPLPDFDPAFDDRTDVPHAVAYATIDPNHTAWWVDIWIFPTLKPPRVTPTP